VYEDEEYVHLVMENCKGYSLNQIIKHQMKDREDDSVDADSSLNEEEMS